MRSDPDKTKVLFLIFDSARGGPGTRAGHGRAGHGSTPTNFQYFGLALEESSSSRPHTASHARTHARTHALHRDRNRNRFPGWTHPPTSNNGFLDVLMGVSYVFVSMIMDRSLRFHLNLDCSIFVLAISQSRACCMYRNVYSIQTCEITIILFRSSP